MKESDGFCGDNILQVPDNDKYKQKPKFARVSCWYQFTKFS